jgi:hypothetical protein
MVRRSIQRRCSGCCLVHLQTERTTFGNELVCADINISQGAEAYYLGIPQPLALSFASTPPCNAEKSDHLQSCDEAADQTASPQALPQRQPCSECQPRGDSVREVQSSMKLGRGTKCTSETAEGT